MEWQLPQYEGDEVKATGDEDDEDDHAEHAYDNGHHEPA